MPSTLDASSGSCCGPCDLPTADRHVGLDVIGYDRSIFVTFFSLQSIALARKDEVPGLHFRELSAPLLQAGQCHLTERDLSSFAAGCLTLSNRELFLEQIDLAPPEKPQLSIAQARMEGEQDSRVERSGAHGFARDQQTMLLIFCQRATNFPARFEHRHVWLNVGPKAMLSQDRAQRADFHVDRPRTRFLSLALCLVPADVVRSDVSHQELAEVRLQVSDVCFFDPLVAGAPVRRICLKPLLRGEAENKRLLCFLQPCRAQLQVASAFSLDPGRNFPSS